MFISLQLDISGKLYLAPLTTVGGGWVGSSVVGSLGHCWPSVPALLTSDVPTSVETYPFAVSASASVQM